MTNPRDLYLTDDGEMDDPDDSLEPRKTKPQRRSRTEEQAERIRDLEAEIKRLKDQMRVREVHSADDLHRVKSRVVKSLKPEVARLEDLLVANSRTPSKTHIVEAYGRDTLDKIVSVLESMK